MILNLVGKSKYGFPIFISFMALSLSVSGQDREIGVGLGGLTYTGDLVRNYDFTRNRPAVLFYLRNNISEAVSIRYGLLAGIITGDDDDPIDVFGVNRSASFDIFLFEVAVTLEYHFLSFRNPKSRLNWSPYFFGGVAVFRMFGADQITETYSNIQPALPFGVGIKYNTDSRFRASFEFGARKLFFDYLDNISGITDVTKNFQYGNENDTDWYYFTGFTLSYSLHTIPCAFNFYNR